MWVSRVSSRHAKWHTLRRRNQGTQASKQKQCDQRARLGSPQQSLEDRTRGVKQQSRQYINVGATRLAVLPLQANVFGYVDAGARGAVRRQSLTPLGCRNRDEVRQGMETLEQGQLSRRHGDSSGGCQSKPGVRTLILKQPRRRWSWALSPMGNRRLARLRATKGRTVWLQLDDNSRSQRREQDLE